MLVNKADGALADAAGRTVAEYRNALHLMRPRTPAWTPTVEACSALTGTGIEAAWERTLECRAASRRPATSRPGAPLRPRSGFARRSRPRCTNGCGRDPRLEPLAARLEEEVRAGRTAPPAAARRLLDAFFADPSPGP